VIDAALNDLVGHDQVVSAEDLIQPGRDATGTEVAASGLKAVGACAARSVFLDNEDLDVSIQAPGFTKNMVREKRTGWPASNDGNVGTTLQARRLKGRTVCGCLGLPSVLLQTAASR